MVGTRSPRGASKRVPDEAPRLVWIAPDGSVHPERRVRRSRLPATCAVFGGVAGTVLADLAILGLFGASVVEVAPPTGWADPWTALWALRDPALALASLVVGGLPGALTGHTWAVRMLRKARLDGLLQDRG